MPIGTVKFSHAEQGDGFVPRRDGEDVFASHPNVKGTELGTFEAGRQVELEVGPGRKGGTSRNVKGI